MIKTRRTKRTFSPEFKLEAIEQVVKYQRDVRGVAHALELNPDSGVLILRATTRENEAGINNAAPAPWRMRKRISCHIATLIPHPSEAQVNRTSPDNQMRREP